jgi:glutaredoxin-related protein
MWSLRTGAHTGVAIPEGVCMIKIYGSMLCPDCVDCCADLDNTNIQYEFLDFAASLKNLKEFLAIRDREAVFEDVRQKGSIGIPCIVREDGSVTLSWEEFLPM